jgi:hypothetical protein
MSPSEENTMKKTLTGLAQIAGVLTVFGALVHFGAFEPATAEEKAAQAREDFCNIQKSLIEKQEFTPARERMRLTCDPDADVELLAADLALVSAKYVIWHQGHQWGADVPYEMLVRRDGDWYRPLCFRVQGEGTCRPSGSY